MDKLNIVLVGDGYSGKSSFFYRYSTNIFPRHIGAGR